MKTIRISATLSIIMFCASVQAADNQGTAQEEKSRLVANLDAGKKQTVVTFGTSLTKVGAWPYQLGAVLEQNYPGQAKVINGGRGGSNSAWGRTALDDNVLKHKPDTVFIEFAINDSVASRKVSIEKGRENLEDMIDRILKANPDSEIILMTMNPPIAGHKARRPDVASYYQMYRDVAKARGLQLIDHYPAWKKILDEQPGLFIGYVPDGIHPVREGSVNVIMPAIMQALGLKRGNPEASGLSPCWDYMFKSMDKNVKKNWEVTKEEYSKFWQNIFKSLDKDKDGSIKLEEHEPAVIFNYIDADDDGRITVEEYQAAYSHHFGKHDANGDGKLVKGEIWLKK